MLDQHLAEKFVLFLENNDGPNWNQLVTELCSIYAKTQEDKAILYLPNATAETTVYATRFFQKFAKSEQKRFLNRTKTALIGYAAGQIAIDSFVEFKAGHVY